MGLEQTNVDELVSKEQHWVLAISLQPDEPRFAPGLFNQARTYGDQTTTVHKIRDQFHDDVDLYFVVRADDLQGAVQEFQEACMEHENELKRAQNGELFEAKIQVFAVAKQDSNTYMACLRLPDEIQRPRVGSSVEIRWQAHDMKALLEANDEMDEEGTSSCKNT